MNTPRSPRLPLFGTNASTASLPLAEWRRQKTKRSARMAAGNPVTPSRKMREPLDNVQKQCSQPGKWNRKEFPIAGRISPQAKVRKPSGTMTPVSGTAARFTIGADNGYGENRAPSMATFSLQRYREHQELPHAERQRQSANQNVAC